MTAPTTDDVRVLPWRRVGVLALVAGVPLTAFAAGVLLPYYANDLDALPLAEVAGGEHDPKDLWPADTWWGPWLRLAGILVGGASPIAMIVVALVAVVYAVRGSVFSLRRRRSPAMVAVLAVLAACCLWGAIWFLGPVAGALWTWTMD